MEPKKYAIIENGVVINTVVATQEYAEEQGWIEISPDPGGPGLGHVYENGTFSLPPRNIEAEWNEIRERRDKLLLETDPIVATPDRWALLPPEKQQEWLDYRQALRDLPTTAEDPYQAIWPTKPES